MSQTNNIEKKRRSAKAIVAIIAAAIAVAVACFTVVMLLPESDKPFFDSPLRSALAGVGLLGAACPLLIAGSLLRKHAAGSPYFEEGFIAGVLTFFGYILLIVALVCLVLAAYALIERLLIARWPARGGGQ
jgi:hypothetical protein